MGRAGGNRSSAGGLKRRLGLQQFYREAGMRDLTHLLHRSVEPAALSYIAFGAVRVCFWQQSRHFICDWAIKERAVLEIRMLDGAQRQKRRGLLVS